MAGLRARTVAPCAGFFQLKTGSPRPMCSHGPDPAPAGVDVTLRRNVADLTSGTTGDTVNADGVPCIGDGTSGSRVQPVYAVALDAIDRYASIAPLISQWAGEMDFAVDQSAAETGGERHISFEMDADCSLKILHVTLSPSGDDTFSNTITIR